MNIIEVTNICLLFCFTGSNLSHALSDSDIEKRFDALLERVIRLEHKNAALETESRKKDVVINELEEDIQLLKQRVGITEDAIANVLQWIGDSNITEMLNWKLGANKVRRGAIENEVAFFATVTPHDVDHLGSNQNIRFNNAVTNIGNGYHSVHGIFTAPVDGTYVFAITVAGRPSNNYFYCYLDVNDSIVVKFLTQSYEQSTNVVVLQLKAGSDVSVKNSNVDDNILGDTYSSFSGFLLYQTYDTYPNVVG